MSEERCQFIKSGTDDVPFTSEVAIIRDRNDVPVLVMEMMGQLYVSRFGLAIRR